MCTKAFTPMTKADKLSLENVSIIKVLCIYIRNEVIKLIYFMKI